MQTSREDFGIIIRSAFLKKGAQQRFSLFFLILFSIVLLFLGTFENKPLDSLKFIIKDVVYRSSVIISSPLKGFRNTTSIFKSYINVFNENVKLKEENKSLKKNFYDPDFLIFENKQLRKLIDEGASSPVNLISSRVILDKQSPYLNSFIINSGTNKKIKKGMAVLDGKNFIGRIVDVNFFSSRVLLISDLNSKIPVIIEPSGTHAILSGTGKQRPTLEYLPDISKIKKNDKVFTSGKAGVFLPGIPIGKIQIEDEKKLVKIFSDLSQVTFINVVLGNSRKFK